MFKLYYPQLDGSLQLIGAFNTQADAEAQAVLDNQVNYTIQQFNGQDVVMVMSC